MHICNPHKRVSTHPCTSTCTYVHTPTPCHLHTHVLSQELLGDDPKVIPEEENVDALCQLLLNIGKQMDELPKGAKVREKYYVRVQEICDNPAVQPRLRSVTS